MANSLDSVEDVMGQLGCMPSLRCGAGQAMLCISTIALFIIGCVATAGAMPMATAGWLAVGFGAAGLVGNLCAGGLKDRKCMVILGTLTAASFILVGALGVAGIGALTTTKAIGIAVLVLALVPTTICSFGCDVGIKAALRLQQPEQQHQTHFRYENF